MGVILYSSLVGRLPFVGKTSRLLMAAIVHADPRPLGAGRHVPAEAASLVMSALAKNPDARPSMRELSDALVAIAKEHAPGPVDLAALIVPASSAAFDTEHFERPAIAVPELRPRQAEPASTTGLGTGDALPRRRLPIPWLVTGALLMLALVFALWARDERARGAAPAAPAARLEDRPGRLPAPARRENVPEPSAPVEDETAEDPVAEPRQRAASPRTRRARSAPPNRRAEASESPSVAPDEHEVAADTHQGGAPAPTTMSSLTAPAPSTERGPRMIREF
jgi:serine/threonine-protein kinase